MIAYFRFIETTIYYMCLTFKFRTSTIPTTKFNSHKIRKERTMTHLLLTSSSLWSYQSDFLCIEQNTHAINFIGTSILDPRQKQKITS